MPHRIDISIKKIITSIEVSDTVLAVEGDAFDILLRQYKDEPEIIYKIVKKIAIYGRSRPDQKERVVEILKKMNEPKDIKIGFVGDGSNDSKALNSAHMGLSISNIETSIAGSFSSPEKDIAPVIDLLIEGRYSLENLIQIVKISFYVGWMKSLALVLIYWMGQWETSYDFLVNVMYMLPIFISVSLSGNSGHLNPFMPKAGLLDSQSLKQFLIALVLGTLYLLVCFYAAISRSEYKNITDVLFVPMKTNIDEDFFIENKFLTFCFVINYFVVTLALHRGYPFKQPFYKNYILVCYITASFLISLTPLLVQYTHYSFERFANAYMRNVEFDAELKIKAIFYPLLFTIIIVSSINIIDSAGMARQIRRMAQKREMVVKV
jgi:magnesium-transporting ATPase (P-type)